MRCFSVLKHVGKNLIMPPYTIDEGLDNFISGKYGHVSFVGLHLARVLPTALVPDHICPEFFGDENSTRVNPPRILESCSFMYFRSLYLYEPSRLFHDTYLS
jgi:hypothetical protein